MLHERLEREWSDYCSGKPLQTGLPGMHAPGIIKWMVEVMDWLFLQILIHLVFYNEIHLFLVSDLKGVLLWQLLLLFIDIFRCSPPIGPCLNRGRSAAGIEPSAIPALTAWWKARMAFRKAVEFDAWWAARASSRAIFRGVTSTPFPWRVWVRFRACSRFFIWLKPWLPWFRQGPEDICPANTGTAISTIIQPTIRITHLFFGISIFFISWWRSSTSSHKGLYSLLNYMYDIFYS